MTHSKISRLILDALEQKTLPANIRAFVRELVEYEKGRIDQQNPHYKQAYTSLINKHVTKVDPQPSRDHEEEQ